MRCCAAEMSPRSPGPCASSARRRSFRLSLTAATRLDTTSKADANGTTTYSWDYENRLTSVTLPGSGGIVTFKYDPFGRRIQKASASTTTNFLYDGANMTAEYDAAGNLVARYSQGSGIDEPLAISRGGTIDFYNADGLGSITSLRDGTGSLVASYTTDAFGQTLTASGSFASSFRFTARELDPETGLYYYRARYYDPKTGRFVSVDPIGFKGGTNFYRYTYNNPVRFTDPSGQTPALALPALGPVGWVAGGVLVTYVVVTNPTMQQGVQQAAQAVGDAVTNFFRNPPWDRTKVRPIPAAPTKCKDDDKCMERLVTCLENPWQPSWNRSFGVRKDCGACYRECKHAGGVWPEYKCPE
jgi:RHS repeat-associated protein